MFMEWTMKKKRTNYEITFYIVLVIFIIVLFLFIYEGIRLNRILRNFIPIMTGHKDIDDF